MPKAVSPRKWMTSFSGAARKVQRPEQPGDCSDLSLHCSVLCANFLCVNAPWGPLKVSNQSRFPGAAQRSAGQLQQQPAQGPAFSLGGPAAQSLANLPTQDLPLQRL